MRRSKGEGNLKQLQNGKWKARMSYVDGQGKRHQLAVRFVTRKKALAWLHEMYSKHDRGQLADSGRRTVGQWLDEWLTMKKPQVELRSYDNWEAHVRLHLKPYIGRIPLAKLRPKDVARLYSDLTDKDTSAAMRNKIGVTLSMALNDAVKMQYLASNPALAIRKPKAKEPDIRPLDADQVRLFLAATEPDRLQALYVLAVDTGMRQGELFALHWPEVDFTAGVITIKYSLEEAGRAPSPQRAEDRIFSTPSGGYAGHHESVKRPSAGDAKSRAVSPGRAGLCGHCGKLAACKSNVRRRSFDKALKKAGLPAIRFYDLRHTATTLMLLSGINIKAVAATLGHSKASTTLNIYAHKLPMMDKERVNAMQRILSAG